MDEDQADTLISIMDDLAATGAGSAMQAAGHMLLKRGRAVNERIAGNIDAALRLEDQADEYADEIQGWASGEYED